MSTSVRTVARERATDKGLIRLLGPAFVAAIAYVDPGNVAANLSAGSQYGYLLVWVLVVANSMAVIANTCRPSSGLVTGRSLPEILGVRLPRSARLALLGPGGSCRGRDRSRRGDRRRVGPAILFGFPLVLGRRHRRARVDGHPRHALPGPASFRVRHHGVARRDHPGLRRWRVRDARSTGAARPGARPPVRGHQHRAVGREHARRDRHAARDLPALGAVPRPPRRRLRICCGSDGCCTPRDGTSCSR